jgi:N-acyl amino acid synthase of PEP-CTERM/exosortase system
MRFTGITEHFFEHFTPIFASTKKLKEEAYKIRYQVYCQELNYESSCNFPEKKEQDAYDTHSYQFLLQHNLTGQYAGCVRMVMPESQQSEAQFPLEKVSRPILKLNKYSRSRFCEVSRIAIPGALRKRQENKNTPGAKFFSRTEKNQSQTEKTSLPVIALALHGIPISMAAAMGIDILCLIEPAFARHLRIYGITSHQVGPMIDYRGKRGPFLLQPQEILANLDPDLRQLFQNIQQHLSKSVPSTPLAAVKQELLLR